jgi:WD40 repeat protein
MLELDTAALKRVAGRPKCPEVDTMPEKPFAYDVFLCHSPLDKPAVRALAQRLKDDGLRVWFDDWEIEPGQRRARKVQQGLRQSRTLVLVLSANAFGPDWEVLERQTALFRDPASGERRFLPLRLDDAEIKEALRPFAPRDWRQSSAEQYAALLTACRPVGASPESGPRQKEKQLPSKVLFGGKSEVWCVAVTADGRRAVSGSWDATVRVWDLDAGRCLATLEGHTSTVWGVAVTSDGRRAVSGSDDGTLRVWDLDAERCLATLQGHTDDVCGVAVTADGRRVVSGSHDGTLRVWDLGAGQRIATLEGHTGSVYGVAVTADGRRAVSGASDHTVRVWNLDAGRCLATLEGHTDDVHGVAVTVDGRRAVSGADDNTVRVWDLDAGRCLATLEGHTDYVSGVAVTAGGRRAVSGSRDTTVRVWDLDAGRCLATLVGHTSYVHGVAVTADGRRAVSGSADHTVGVWDLRTVEEAATSADATRYTNAKVLLVGDSGVGKSGLALRLTEDRFEPTISTDGVWATQLNLPHDARTADTEREIWLWDFAGQADYRLIHQLFMDETAVAVLVFNPQSENPFEGLGQWDRALQRAARRPFRKLLVAGRCDRGTLMVSRDSIHRFREERGYADYLETSALVGTGCPELREAIIANIAWEEIPWTASPRLFKVLKDAIIRLKDEGKMLFRVAELKQQLEMRLPQEPFSLDELRAVVRLLAGPGVVWQLEFGDFVLLQPERINAYAAAVVRSVRAHPEGIGCIPEERVLAGNLDYQDLKRLPPDEEQVVLRAMNQTLVGHGLCLREPTEAGPLLVFPSYFTRERPELEEHPSAFVTYQFSGPLDEVYATLVIRLHHTAAFSKDRLWRFAADFKTHEGKRIGLKMTKKAEGTAEITVYVEAAIPDDTKVTFIRYVHDHLKAKDPNVTRVRHYVCPHPRCGEPVGDARAIKKALERGEKDIPCQFCRKDVPLFDLIEQKFASDEFQRRVRELEEQARTEIDNQSKELILVGHAFAIAAEAGQVFRPTPNSDWGIDGEIEFKDYRGRASGQRVYLQLKSGDSYLRRRQKDEAEVFRIPEERLAEYWQRQAYPVMLVIRTSDGVIRWMDVSAYLKAKSKGNKKPVKQLVFQGEPFTALNLQRLRDKLVPPPEA